MKLFKIGLAFSLTLSAGLLFGCSNDNNENVTASIFPNIKIRESKEVKGATIIPITNKIKENLADNTQEIDGEVINSDEDKQLENSTKYKDGTTNNFVKRSENSIDTSDTNISNNIANNESGNKPSSAIEDEQFPCKYYGHSYKTHQETIPATYETIWIEAGWNPTYVIRDYDDFYYTQFQNRDEAKAYAEKTGLYVSIVQAHHSNSYKKLISPETIKIVQVCNKCGAIK